MFLKENISMSITISLKFAPKILIDNIPALVQIMAWRRPGDKPLSEPMMVSSLTYMRHSAWAIEKWWLHYNGCKHSICFKSLLRTIISIFTLIYQKIYSFWFCFKMIEPLMCLFLWITIQILKYAIDLNRLTGGPRYFAVGRYFNLGK